MRHGHHEDERATPAAAPRGLAARWTDLSLRTKGLIVVAIPMSALLAVGPVYFLAGADAGRGRARVLIAALFFVGLGGGMLATLVLSARLVRRVATCRPS